MTVGMDFFHEKLPIEKMLAGKPIEWNLSKPSISGFFYELGGGIADFFMDPYKGAKDEGAILVPRQGKRLYCNPVVQAGDTYHCFTEAYLLSKAPFECYEK